MEEYDIDSLLGEMDFNSGKLQDIGNGKDLIIKESFIDFFSFFLYNIFEVIVWLLVKV